MSATNGDGEVTLLRGYDKVHLKLGSHGLFLVKSEEQWPATLSLLINAGVQHKEICAVFSPQKKIDSLTRYMKKSEESIAVSLKKDVRFFPSRRASGAHSPFESLYETFQQLVLDAHKMHREGVRAIVDMGWYFGEKTGRKLLSFENEMDELLASREFPLTLICAYDLRKIEGLFTIDLLDLHPHVIYGNVEDEPPFFIRVATRLFRDPLTKLYNVRYLQERLAEEMDRNKRYGGEFSVLVGDVDRFQAINDKFGYIKGDRILVEIAKTLGLCVRKVDLVCRYGDDSFILLLPETSKQGSQIISERIHEAVGKIRLKEAELSFSLGTATYPQDGKTKEALILKALKALKSAKHSRPARVAAS